MRRRRTRITATTPAAAEATDSSDQCSVHASPKPVVSPYLAHGKIEAIRTTTKLASANQSPRGRGAGIAAGSSGGGLPGQDRPSVERLADHPEQQLWSASFHQVAVDAGGRRLLPQRDVLVGGEH